MATMLALWLLSGLTQVPPDGRAIYEEFGTPVRVLQPGLHALLPWPAGRVHRLDYGAVREVPPIRHGTAEIHVLYRVGLSDADARQAVSLRDAAALVQAEAERAFCAWPAPNALGKAATHQALRLRGDVQAALRTRASGLEVLEVTVGDTGSADPGWRAADIVAQTALQGARGDAAFVAATARQEVFARIADARARAAEIVAAARANAVVFQADQQAARAGGQAFLLERYLAALQRALAKAPKTIIDHRLNWPEAPVLDLRPLSSAALTAGDGKEE